MKYLLALLLLVTNTAIAVDLNCPVPKSDWVNNNTGIQCVWSSIELLGRWANEPKLLNLTQRRECQGMSDPSSAKRMLDSLGVKFRQSYGNKDEGRRMIKWAMASGRGCMFGANRQHAMVIVHYDEAANRVHIVDNSNLSKGASLMSIEDFNRMWDGWVLVIQGDKDVFPKKAVDRRAIRMWYNKGA